MANFLSKFLQDFFKKDTIQNFPGTQIPVVVVTPDGKEVVINSNTAQSIDTVYACARLISEQISTLPIRVAQIDAQTSIKTYKSQHPLQSIIDNPVSYTNRNAYWQKIVYHLLLWGNHYSEITREAGETIGYNIVHPMYVEYKPQAGVYVVDEGKNSKRVVRPENMCHVVLAGDDNVVGTSIIGRVAKNDLSHALYVRRYGSGFFKNGGKPNNIITTKDNVTPQQAKEWQDYYNKNYGDGGTAILGGAEDIKNLSFPPNDSQFLETRMFNVETIARWFNIDPPLIGHLKDGTLSNFETIWRNFAKKTLIPITEQIETEYTRKSFRDSQYKKGYRFEFDYTRLTKGSPNEEAELLRTYIQNGIMTPNEARQRVGLNPLEGGDDAFMQSATIPIRLIEEQINGQNNEAFSNGNADESE